MISTLRTKRFFLTPIRTSDTAEVYDLRSDPAVIKFLGRHAIESMEKAKEFIEKTITEVTENEYYKWAIRESQDGKLFGNIGLFNIDKNRNRVDIGYALRAQYHRKGIMFECMSKVLDIAFQELKFHSVGAETDPSNEASQNLLIKHGFRKEGHFSENYLFDGKYLDSANFSLLEKWR